MCKCGNTLEPFKVGSKWFTPHFCSTCIKNYHINKTTTPQPKIKPQRDRRQYQETMYRLLADAISPLFVKAHLRGLSPRFREALLSYDPFVGLVLYGPVGRGKSYAMSALVRHLILQGRQCVTITYEMLCLKIRATYQSNNQTELGVIQPLSDCDCLFIEDVGSTTSIGRNESDFSVRTFYVLLESRLRNCVPTFITTNKTHKNIAKSFDSRIASRLKMFPWVGVGGSDRRKSNE